VKLALPNTVFKRSSVEEVAAAVAAHGAEAVEYFLALSGGLPDVEGCRRIRRAFESNGVAIDHVGGYVNPISTDPELRRAGVEHLKGLCRLSGDLGSRMIATFSGTAVPATGLEWTPESHSQASYDLFIEVIRDVLRVAAAKGVTILIEPFVVTVMKDPDTALRIFEDVGSPHLGLAMDIVNFYNLADLEQPRQNELGRTSGRSTPRTWAPRTVRARRPASRVSGAASSITPTSPAWSTAAASRAPFSSRSCAPRRWSPLPWPTSGASSGAANPPAGQLRSRRGDRRSVGAGVVPRVRGRPRPAHLTACVLRVESARVAHSTHHG
jgi:hypothetical protein